MNDNLRVAKQVKQQQEDMLQQLDNEMDSAIRENVQITLQAFLDDYTKPLEQLNDDSKEFRSIVSSVTSVVSSLQKYSVDTYNDTVTSLKARISSLEGEIKELEEIRDKRKKEAKRALEELKNQKLKRDMTIFFICAATSLAIVFFGFYKSYQTYQEQVFEFENGITLSMYANYEEWQKIDSKKKELTTAAAYDEYLEYCLETYVEPNCSIFNCDKLKEEYTADFVKKFGERPLE